MLFTPHSALLPQVFSTEAGYVPAEVDGMEDAYRVTVQWSRRFIGLKVFATIAARGASGISADVELQTAMGRRLRELLWEAGWLIVNDTPLPVVCFTHPAIRSGAASLPGVLDRVVASGSAWLSTVDPGNGETVLRACITSHRTDEADLKLLLAELQGAVGHEPRKSSQEEDHR